MAPKKPQNIYYPEALLVPSNQKSTTSTGSKGRQLMESTELKCATKNIFKDQKGNSTTTFKQTYNAGEFLDKSSGRLGYKEEIQYIRTDKYDNKEEGYTHEYETQVKLKHVAYPTESTGFNSENKEITYDNDNSYDYHYYYDHEHDYDYY